MKFKQLLCNSIGSRQSRLANLRADLDRSPVTEMKELINTPNGKLFEAPKRLMSITDESPRLDAAYQLKSLNGQSYNLLHDIVAKLSSTLLTVSCSSFSDPMVDTFRQPFLQSPQFHNGSCGLIDLRPIPSRLKYMIWGPLVKRAAGNQEPNDRHHAYFVYRGGQELRAMLGVPNLFGGFVFLFDRAGYVRWRASGSATEEEITTLFECIKQLGTK